MNTNNSKLENQRQLIQLTIDYTEGKIDEVEYGLYDITEEEIVIVEESAR